MRVLLCTLPQHTHFLTAAPLMWALRTAGHDVRVASQRSLADSITRAGLTAVPVGRDVDVERVDEEEEREEYRRGLPPPFDMVERGPDTVTWEEIKTPYAAMFWGMHKLHNFPLIADLVRFAQQWQPDLILWEPTTYAGPIAAKACGAAHGRLSFTLDILGITHQRVRELNSAPADDEDPLVHWLASYGPRYGYEFSDDMVLGQFTVDQTPPSLRVEADLPYVRMRYTPYGGPAVVPGWLRAAPERPRIALTMGLSATQHFGGYTFDVAEILAALRDLDIEVVATVAEEEQAALGTVPDNARVESFVPLHALAPTCSAVIHHAGFGTINTVIAAGVPQLVLPYHFEGPLLAEKVVAQGAGLALAPEEVSAAAVRESVLRLIREPSFAERARAFRDELTGLPSPNEVVPVLEELTRTYRARGERTD